MTGHHSPENGATSAPAPSTAPHAHVDAPQAILAHPGRSDEVPAAWRWTDTLVVACALGGFFTLIAVSLYALLAPVNVVEVHEIRHVVEQPSRSTIDRTWPAPAPIPVPMVVARLDDPRAHVLVPAWTVTVR